MTDGHTEVADRDTSAAALDLDAYFERIRWRGPVDPTGETLAGLVRAHMRAIPFENLDILLGRGIRLDLAALQDKLVRARRGGYCFEHATLFAAVLEALGFAPVRHSARVVLYRPAEASPRTHMFLTVALPDATYVVDPGFGGFAPAMPVPLTARTNASAAAISHWMARVGPRWVLQARTDEGGIVDCWASTLEPDNPIDFAVANHYTATHPESAFVNRIMLCATTDEGRITVMNRDVTIRSGDASHSTRLPDRGALRAMLATHFGFDLPEAETLRVPSIGEWR